MAQGSAPVKLVYRKETYSVRPGMTLRAALEKIEINPEEVLGLREGKLMTDDLLLEEGETIKLVSVISGG
jgi:sulfur carrier protein ThiS